MKRFKNLSLVLALAMVLQILMPVNFAYADEGDDITDDMIWDNFFLTILDAAGNQLDKIDIADTTSGTAISSIPRDAKIKIDADFALPDDDPENAVQYNFKTGDYFELRFPEVIEFEDGEYELLSQGIDLKLILSGSDAKFVITRIMESNISGKIWMEGSINEDKIAGDEGASVDLEFMGKIIRLEFEDYEPPEIAVTLEKSGEFVYDRDLQAGGILWTIEVTTDTLTDGVKIEDDFGSNQEFVLGSLAVEGVFVEDNDYGIEGTVLKYEFKEEISGKKVITYLTKPKLDAFDGKETQSNKTVKFSNGAKVYLDDIEKDKDSDEVELNSIKKDGEKITYDVSGRRIKWRITINNYNFNGENPYIEDTIHSNLVLVEDDVYPISISYDGEDAIKLGTDDYKYADNKLKYDLKDNFETAVLTYYTDINIPDDNANDNNLEFTNEAYLKWDGAVTGTWDGAKVGIDGGMIRKSSSKNWTMYKKGENDIIKWTVTINENKLNIPAGAKFVDAIPEGLEFLPDTFMVDGEKATINTTGSAIEYTFENGFNSKHTITYNTKIIDSHIPIFQNGGDSGTTNFKNDAKFVALEKDHKSSDNQGVKSSVIKKTGGKYDFDTGILTWKIVVNESKIKLNNAVLTDEIKEGMEFISGSFTVNGDMMEPDPIYSNIITYHFPEDTEESYTITFQVKVDKEYLKETNVNVKVALNNKAVLTDNEKIAESSDKVIVDNKVIEKNMKISEDIDYIDWEVPINASKLIFSDIEIWDDIQDELELDFNTVQLFEATVDPNTGKLNKGNPVALKDITDWDGSSEGFYKGYGQNEDDGKNRLTIKIRGIIFEPYILEFTTEIAVRNSFNLSNTINFSGNGVVAHDTKGKTNMKISEAGGSVTSGSGKLTVQKVDKEENIISDKDATFRIYRKFLDEKILVKEGQEEFSTTGGEVALENLLYKKHFIEEVIAPEGYLRDGTLHEVWITSNEPNVTYQFENIKAEAEIVLIKESTSGMKLSGAEFTLYESDGETVFEGREPVSSNEEGKVVFTGIPSGKYIIKETVIPAGYKALVDELLVIVEINEDNTAMVVVINDDAADEDYIVLNQLVTDEVMVIKVDAFGNGLENAKFGLYQGEKLIDTSHSNENGTAQFGKIVAGEYTIKEITAPDGYIKSDTVIFVNVSENNEELEINYGTSQSIYDLATAPEFENNSIDIEFIKQNNNNRPLKGAEFTLYNEDGETVFEDREPVGSDDEGKVVFTIVPEGTYVIKETRTPSGYRQLLKDIIVVIELDGEGQPEITLSYSDESDEVTGENGEFIVVNERRPSGGGQDPVFGKIAIKKTDEDKKVLSGAEFTLYDEDGKVVAKGASGSEGTLSFDNLVYGTYVIKETKAPKGYVITVDEREVVINSAAVKTFTFTNEKEEPVKPEIPEVPEIPVIPETPVVPANGRITINKVDEDNMALAGADFTLYNENNQVLGTAVSDESGRVIFENLEDGKYFVRETKAPEGYEIVSDALTVDVTEGKSYNYRFRNVPTDTEIEDPNVPKGWEEIDDLDVPVDTIVPPTLPDTGSLFNTWMLAVVGFIFISIGLVLFSRRRIRN